MYILYFSNSQWVRFAYAAVKFVADRKSKLLVIPTSTHCHPERSEGSAVRRKMQNPRFARNDNI
jgi:hypothetical protein